MSALPSRRLLVPAVLLSLLAALAWWAVRPASEAAPAPAPPAAPAVAPTAQAGKVAFSSLPNGPATTLPIRSFKMGATGTTPGGGGGAGAANVDGAVAVLAASAVDPLLFRGVTTGAHVPKVTVRLFRPGTTKRLQTWVFESVTLTQMRQTQSGSAKSPRVTLGWAFDEVTLTTYAANGNVARSYCYSVVTNENC